MKIAKGQQSSFPLGAFFKVLPGHSTDLSGWVGFCTSSPQQGVQYQILYLDFFGGTL